MLACFQIYESNALKKLFNLLGGTGGMSSKDYIGLFGGGGRSSESKKGLRNFLSLITKL